jgi:hypothetical protein
MTSEPDFQPCYRHPEGWWCSRRAIELERLRKRHPEAFNLDGTPNIPHPSSDALEPVTEYHTDDPANCPTCEANTIRDGVQDAAIGVNLGPKDTTDHQARTIAESL